MDTEALVSSSSEPKQGLTSGQKTKIFFFLLTYLCAIGYIICGLLAFFDKGITISLDTVATLYCFATGVFFIIALIPIRSWRIAMETIFPFAFSFYGRSAILLLISPFLTVAEVTGIVFGVISLLSAFALTITYFVVRNTPQKKTFFHPFEQETVEKTHNFDYGVSLGVTAKSNSTGGYQQQAFAQNVPETTPKRTSTSVDVKRSASSVPTAQATEQTTNPPAQNYNPFADGLGASSGADVSKASMSIAKLMNRNISSNSNSASSSTTASPSTGRRTPSEQQFSNSNPFAPPPGDAKGPLLEEVSENPFEKKSESECEEVNLETSTSGNSPPPTNTSLNSLSQSSNNPFNY